MTLIGKAPAYGDSINTINMISAMRTQGHKNKEQSRQIDPLIYTTNQNETQTSNEK